MIKIAIIDDEQHCIDILMHYLQNMEDVEIVFTTNESKNAKSLLKIHEPNLVFLDIEMPNINGIDLAFSLEDCTYKIVFTTAYQQYAIQAFKLNALDYLLKPIALSDIQNCLDKYKKNELLFSTAQIENLKNNYNNKILDTIALSTQAGLIFIQLKNIAYIEGDGSYTTIYMQDGVKHLVSKNLSSFSEILEENQFLFRPHKSFIINLKYIKQYIRGEGGEIVLHNGKSITLSRQKKLDFLAKFNKI